MDFKDIFNIAHQVIDELIEKEGDKEAREQLKLKIKELDLYVQTESYRKLAYKQFIRDIEEDHLIQGQKIRFTHKSKDEEHELIMKCNKCGATVFNVLDKDFVEIYQQTSYCIECVMCGKRGWHKLDNLKLEDIEKIEEEEMIETLEEYEEEVGCEQ